MIVDVYEAVDRMLWALVFWIAVGSALAAPVVLAVAWAVWRIVKWLWRAARRWWSRPSWAHNRWRAARWAKARIRGSRDYDTAA